MTGISLERRSWSVRSQAAIVVAMFALAVGAVLLAKADHGRASPESDTKSQTRRDDGKFYPSAAQWATLAVQPVEPHVFARSS